MRRSPPALPRNPQCPLRLRASRSSPRSLAPACRPENRDEIAMPIRRELRPLYPPHWRELSRHVRFERAGGRQRCGRRHLTLVRCLHDGRWFDDQAATWRDRRGRLARWPDLVEATRFRMTRVVLAAAHLDGDPANNRMTNLRALCQRCHMLQDRPHHLAQRWITYRRRRALGDLFLGSYTALMATLRSQRTAPLPDLYRRPGRSSTSTIGSRPNLTTLFPDHHLPQIQFPAVKATSRHLPRRPD
jgi:hypothetical protein